MKRDKDGRFAADSAAVRSAITARFTEEDKARFVAAAEALGKAPTILLREIALEWLDRQENQEAQKQVTA